MRLELGEIREAVRGAHPANSSALGQVLTRVSIDSRAVEPGNLFVCIPGERVDGHDFAGQALAAGAGGILASRELPGLDPARVVLVHDTVKAMGLLASYWREKCGATLAAVTGSAGKTTVKEMLFAAVSSELIACRNPGNFNNQIGLPLSMLGCEGGEDVWIMEVGISRPGDMDELGAIARPDLALVTNVGAAHVEGLGGVAGVARAKASLFGHLARTGEGLACKDYPELWEEASRYRRVRAFSTRDESCEFFCRLLGRAEGGEGVYELRLPGFVAEVELPFAAGHLAENVAAAAAAAWILGVSGEGVARGLSRAVIPARRFIPHSRGSLVLIDDTYNANPLSMSRSARAARDLARDTPLVFVLGDMLEMGEAAGQAHEDLGRELAGLAPAAVFHHGSMAGAVEAGLEAGKFSGLFVKMDEPADLLRGMKGLGASRAVLLFKGSRGMRMERFLAALEDELERKP